MTDDPRELVESVLREHRECRHRIYSHCQYCGTGTWHWPCLPYRLALIAKEALDAEDARG